MKTINVAVALQVATFHQPIEPLEVDTDQKTIKGTVNSWQDEAASQVAGASPLKVSQYVAPMVDGSTDEDSIDAYLQANIATVVGGVAVTLPTV